MNVTEQMAPALAEAMRPALTATAEAFEQLGRALLPAFAQVVETVRPLLWPFRNVVAYLAEPELNDLRDAGLVL